MKVYHYTKEPFESFDLSKSDGFWFTTIKPSQLDDSEIGCSECDYVAVCEIDFDNSLINHTAHDVYEVLSGSEYDALENIIDNGEIEYTDYALIDSSKITILEWVKI